MRCISYFDLERGETMPWYSEEQIEEVRSRSDIVSVIGRYVRLKRAGSGYTGLCPFHNEKTPSFHVNPARQMYKCFGCGVGGNVLTFVMEYENLTFPEAMEMLAQEAGIELPKQELTAQQKQQESLRQTLLEINKKAARYYFALLKSPRGKPGYDYLTGRGLSDETILHFGLGYAGQGGGELYQYMKKCSSGDRYSKMSGIMRHPSISRSARLYFRLTISARFAVRWRYSCALTDSLIIHIHSRLRRHTAQLGGRLAAVEHVDDSQVRGQHPLQTEVHSTHHRDSPTLTSVASSGGSTRSR